MFKPRTLLLSVTAVALASGGATAFTNSIADGAGWKTQRVGFSTWTTSGATLNSAVYDFVDASANIDGVTLIFNEDLPTADNLIRASLDAGTTPAYATCSYVSGTGPTTYHCVLTPIAANTTTLTLRVAVTNK